MNFGSTDLEVVFRRNLLRCRQWILVVDPTCILQRATQDMDTRIHATICDTVAGKLLEPAESKEARGMRRALRRQGPIPDAVRAGV